MESHGLRATVIPNVIDIEAYPYHQRSELRPHLLWMRTFHPIYNPEMAVRVLARLQRVIPEATLVMAGQEKGQQAAVQRLACELGVGDTIRFPGFLGMDDKFRAGTAADIFLNTNRVDNMPVSVIEACAMGLPVVATSVGGVPDLLTDGETGLLVPDDDDAMMAARVIELLRNPVLASRLSANGRQLAERSSWNSVKGQWEQLLCNLQVSPKSKGGVR
jgi:glycosyltransferase involved in cell wall biosynthesis